MNDASDQSSTMTHRFPRDDETLRWLLSSAVLSIGLVVGGYLLGNGLVRARESDRAVTVRGLAQRDVTADLATWTISYSDTGTDLAAVQSNVQDDTRAIKEFFASLGFLGSALQPTGANVSTYTDQGVLRYTVRQRMALRTKDIARAQRAVARQFDLVARGVLLEEGSGMAYTFTKLDEIKPAMVAEATKDARAAAEQFAIDSGTSVGAIKDATQGYFEIGSRDGEGALPENGAFRTHPTRRSAWSPRCAFRSADQSGRGPACRRPQPVQKLAPSEKTTASSVKPSIEGPSVPT
jgi:hypothetical protein